jgi:hypothetical protein
MQLVTCFLDSKGFDPSRLHAFADLMRTVKEE